MQDISCLCQEKSRILPASSAWPVAEIVASLQSYLDYAGVSRTRIPGMSTNFEVLEKRARALSRKEKADLARILVDDLDASEDPGVQQLWLEAAQRRYDAYRAGKLRSLPGDEVMQRVRDKLK